MSDAVLLAPKRVPGKILPGYFDIDTGSPAQPTRIPTRKAYVISSSAGRRHGEIELVYWTPAGFKSASRHGGRAAQATREEQTLNNPRYLVISFAVGVVLFVLGVILLGVSIFARGGTAISVSAAFLAVGSLVVAFSLLRGQDLDERVS